jgi:hypothetical protein
VEHYFTCDNGVTLLNTKYNVIFPHDKNNIDTIDKYIRRFERLKDTILNSTECLYFIYTSQSSLESGNFTIDGNIVINDVYVYMSKIYKLISKFRNNYKINVFSRKFYSKNEIVDILKNILNINVNSKTFEPARVEENKNGKILYYGGNINTSLMNTLETSEILPENTSEEIKYKIKRVEENTNNLYKKSLYDGEIKSKKDLEILTTEEEQNRIIINKKRDENKKKMKEIEKLNQEIINKQNIEDEKKFREIRNALKRN